MHVQLDFSLPAEVAVGAGTALFVGGWCFAPRAPIRSLALVVDGHRQPLLTSGMARRDVFSAHPPARGALGAARPSVEPASADDPFLRSWESGFWGIARIARQSGDGICQLGLRAELNGGGEAATELARIPTVCRHNPATVAEPEPGAGPLVAICMATYEPPLDLFARQLDSIRTQTHGNWVCIISDDCSRPERFDAVREAVGDDPRFVLSRSPRRLGFYLNFERALSMVPAPAQYVAMADQDDFWHPDKLEVLLREIDGALLAYSDARIVDRNGGLISGTYWSRRRNNYSNLLSLLVANSVTGAASLFRRDLLDFALPFPPPQFLQYHDHWLALVALALGEMVFIPRPLYDYVQHGEAWLGHVASNRMTKLRDRVSSQRRGPRQRARLWRRHYFVDACRLMQTATMLQMRCGERMSPEKGRVLERFLDADRSVAPIGRLGLRGARELLGRSETLGAEWMLAHAFAWRRVLAVTNRRWLPAQVRLNAAPPPTLTPRLDLGGLRGTAAGAVAEKTAPLDLAVRDDAPRRVNILIPTIDLRHFFGGYIAKLNLARRLAERGIRTRVVTVDPVGPLPRSWRSQVESYSGLAGVLDRVEVAFGRESHGLEVSRGDRFIATTWWTAHIARAALSALDHRPFVYLIQEYEPFTVPMGSYAALARESYGFEHLALFSTEFLRDYFRLHGIGVYAHGSTAGDAASATFENAITAIDPPNPGELRARKTRKLLFYARPEPHAARNMFELGILAVRRAIEHGAFQGRWELNGIGALESGRRISLADGATLRLLPRSDQRAYADVLRAHDVGLALMYTPHPSLVPIEMASAAMLTVTNSFENKTPEKMAAISENLVIAEPTVEGVAGGLAQAASAVGDLDRRARGSAVRWSHDWDESFNDTLLDRVVAFTGA